MAVIWLDPPLHAATIGVAGQWRLRCPYPGVVCRWIIDMDSTSFSGSITIKSRESGSSDAMVAQPYTIVGSGADSSAALTDSAYISVDATGREIDVDVTSYVSGSMALSAQPAIG